MTNPYQPPNTVNAAPRKPASHRRFLWLSFACMASGVGVIVAAVVAAETVMYRWSKSPPMPGDFDRFEHWMNLFAKLPYISVPLGCLGLYFAVRSACLAPRKQKGAKQT